MKSKHILTISLHLPVIRKLRVVVLPRFASTAFDHSDRTFRTHWVQQTTMGRTWGKSSGCGDGPPGAPDGAPYWIAQKNSNKNEVPLQTRGVFCPDFKFGEYLSAVFKQKNNSWPGRLVYFTSSRGPLPGRSPNLSHTSNKESLGCCTG